MAGRPAYPSLVRSLPKHCSECLTWNNVYQQMYSKNIPHGTQDSTWELGTSCYTTCRYWSKSDVDIVTRSTYKWAELTRNHSRCSADYYSGRNRITCSRPNIKMWSYDNRKDTDGQAKAMDIPHTRCISGAHKGLIPNINNEHFEEICYTPKITSTALATGLLKCMLGPERNDGFKPTVQVKAVH